MTQPRPQPTAEPRGEVARGAEGMPRLDPSVESWYEHERKDDPLWNESAWFGFMIPERNINGWVYFWHRRNMGLSAAGVAVWDGWDGRGQEQRDCLYHDWFNFYEHPQEGDHFNFALQNDTLEVRSPVPLEDYQVRFRNPDITVNLDYHALAEAQADDFGASDSVSFGNFHYDQLTSVRGSITLRGEEFSVDCRHIRDRSWGVRSSFPRGLRGGLDLGYSDDGLTAFVGSMFASVPVDDPTLTKETLTYGHIVKDGLVSTAVSGSRESHRGIGGNLEKVVMEMTDAAGRSVSAEGSPTNVLHYDDLWRTDWSLMRWDSINGSRGWGECQDFGDRELWRARSRSALR